MDKKELLINKKIESNQKEVTPSEAELMYSQSLSLLNNAIEECQLDGFQAVESTVPQVFNQQGMMTNTSMEKTDFFSLAKQLFEQQTPLFSLEGLEQQELASSLTESLVTEQQPGQNEQRNSNSITEVQGNNQQLIQPIEKPLEGNAELPSDNDAGLEAINDLLNSG